MANICSSAVLALVLAVGAGGQALAQTSDLAAEVTLLRRQAERLQAQSEQLQAQSDEVNRRLDALSRQLTEERSARSTAEAEVQIARQVETAEFSRKADLPPQIQTRDRNTAIVGAPGPVGRALQAAGSDFELLAAGDSAKVSIRLSKDMATTQLLGGPEGPATTERLSFAVSAPTNKKDPRSDIFTSDGFSNDFELRIGWGRYTRTIRNPLLYKPAQDMIDEARGPCRVKAEKLAGEKQAEALKVCNAPTIGSGSFIRAAYDDPETAVRKHAEFLGLIFPDGAFAYGIEGRVGYKKHEFVDLTALKVEDDTLSPWGLRVYYGVMPKALQSFTVSLDYAEGKKDAKAGVICPPGSGGPVTCLSGALGPPKEETRHIGALEYRELFPLPETWLVRGVGLAAQVSHDWKNDRTVFDLPIYLVPDAKQNFIGGVRLGWNSEDHDLVAGVFVSSAFGTRPQ